jgi:hypothetical protein
MENECLEFNKIEEPEEPELMREGLGEINMQQGIEVGYVTISGSATDANEIAMEAEDKFSRTEGDAYYTYNFEKPILFSGYMI